MLDLIERVRTLVNRADAEITCDSVMRYGTRIVNADATAEAIIAAFREALLSDAVVEAGAMGLTGARWEVGHRIVKGEKLSAKETARIESHAAISAACAVILRAIQTKEAGHGAETFSGGRP